MALMRVGRGATSFQAAVSKLSVAQSRRHRPRRRSAKGTTESRSAGRDSACAQGPLVECAGDIGTSRMRRTGVWVKGDVGVVQQPAPPRRD